ncbi:hypothetical protein Tco_0492084 [Tanacetum coccineum]
MSRYGKTEYYENEDDSFTDIETEYPAIVFDDTSDTTLSCEPTVSPLENNKIDFKISFDESDDEDYMVVFDENSFSCKIISVDNLKTDSEDEYDKVNLPSSPSPEPTFGMVKAQQCDLERVMEIECKGTKRGSWDMSVERSVWMHPRSGVEGVILCLRVLSLRCLLVKRMDASKLPFRILILTSESSSWFVRYYLLLRGEFFFDARIRQLNLQVGDEAVHKELGDRMERAATTASSLEAEQDSGYTLRSGEDSMKLLELMELCTKLSNMLHKDRKSDLIRYALTINPTIYTSCIEQFWETARAKTVNSERQIQALIDKKKVIIMKSSIRSDLYLEDAGGIDCLPIATIFEELVRMGRKQRNDTVVSQEETQQDDSVPTPSNDPPLSGKDSMQLSELMLLCTNLQKQVLDLEKAKDAQAKEIADLTKRVQKLEWKKKSRPT